MAITGQWIFGVLVVQYLRWPHQNLHGSNMKGLGLIVNLCVSQIWSMLAHYYCVSDFLINIIWIWQVAAIFKIGNSKEIPPIPDYISDEGKNFINLCLQRDPSLRPTASQLLGHPFVRDQVATKSPIIRSVTDPGSTSPYGSHPLVCMVEKCFRFTFFLFLKLCFRCWKV